MDDLKGRMESAIPGLFDKDSETAILKRKMEILEGKYMNTKLVGEPTCTYLMRTHPEKFEKIENMNFEDLKPKMIN